MSTPNSSREKRVVDLFRTNGIKPNHSSSNGNFQPFPNYTKRPTTGIDANLQPLSTATDGNQKRLKVDAPSTPGSVRSEVLGTSELKRQYNDPVYGTIEIDGI